MTVLLAIEASKPNGTVYRAVFGLDFRPLVSWFIVLGRLL